MWLVFETGNGSTNFYTIIPLDRVVSIIKESDGKITIKTAEGSLYIDKDSKYTVKVFYDSSLLVYLKEIFGLI